VRVPGVQAHFDGCADWHAGDHELGPDESANPRADRYGNKPRRQRDADCSVLQQRAECDDSGSNGNCF
jgi:hypothetical protein